MTQSLLGLHWIKSHQTQRDLDHVAAMQYPSVKLFEHHWNNRDACRDLLAVLPKNAYILARDHPLSEQKADMWHDPAGTGTRHANEWAMKVASGNVHVPVERTFFLGLNEPDATDGDRNAIDIYTSSFLDRLRVHGLRGGAFNFSTGHPRTVDGTGATQADYTVFERSHQAIVRGSHIGVLHIYGGFGRPCIPGHYDRLRACPWQDVEWVVGEAGLDQHALTGGGHQGYQAFFGDNLGGYCAWLDELIMGVNDPRIHSYQVFTYDFSHPWSSFNIQPIRDALESYPWRHTRPTKPVTTRLPHVEASPKPQQPVGYVNATSGVNLRATPNTSSPILDAIPYTGQVRIVGVAQDGWLKVRYGQQEGFVSAQYISTEMPKPAPTQPTAPSSEQEAWARSIAFVRRWEGGWADNPNDPGGATNKGITIGTFTRWRIEHGRPTPTVDDLRHISDAETNQIYYEWYWKASGADKLPWPICLAHFDTAVNAGPGRAEQILRDSSGHFLRYMGMLMSWYTTIPNFEHFGRAWIRRRAEILLEASK